MQYDPVTLDVIWNRLISICDEAEAGLMRTSFTPHVREGKDFCCVLLNAKGESVAQGSLSQVAFATTAPHTAQNMLAKFPAETLEPGDVVVTNNPWLCTGHLYDIFVLEPIFSRGQLLALAGSVAHWTDIGGRGEKADNRSIYEEGLQLPVLKLAKRGQFNEEVLAIIRENVRLPDEVMSEFRSQLLGNDLMRTKLVALVEGQGIDDLGELAETILGRTEATMRAAIARIPDGDYEDEVAVEGIDRELTIKVKVTTRGTDMHVDFAGSSAQSEWAINSPPGFTFTYTFVGIKSALAPYLPNNSGQMRPVTMSLPFASCVNPRPRSVGTAARHIVAHSCCTGVLGALSKATRGQVQAQSAPSGGIMLDGVSDTGKPFHAHVNGATGLGAHQNGDGLPCVYFPFSLANIPIEMLESRLPMLRVDRKQIRADSGGAGRYRGGCAEEVEVAIVEQVSGQCCPIVRQAEHPANGVLGGRPGAAATCTLNGSPISALGTYPFKLGDRLGARTAGGGGFGDPLERDPSLVLEDVLDQFVSPEQAEVSYGVVVNAATKRLDLDATALFRQSRRKQDRGAYSA